MSVAPEPANPEHDHMTIDPSNLGSVDPLSVEGIFLVALGKSGDERAAFLLQSCPDAEQRQRVEALLTAYENAGSFLERPAVTAEPTPVGQYLAPCEVPGSIGKLGQYEILEEIGRGGMGVVFRAHDPKLQRIVAVKALAPELARLPVARQRFLREARAAAAISHPHVVTIFAVDGTEEASLGTERTTLPYLVMECIVGQTLHDKIKRVGALKTEEIIRISRQIAEGLTAAHKRGLIHRDIKPANILLENGVERVKITDFGLARTVSDGGITHTGEILGTPQCMSPEQARGELVDQRSDLFSLGCVMYTMCTGVSPFRADNILAVMKKVCETEPRPVAQLNPNIPEWLCGLVHQLLEKQPERRVQTAGEVVEMLESRVIAGGPRTDQTIPDRETMKSFRLHPESVPQWLLTPIIPGLEQWLFKDHLLPVTLIAMLVGFFLGENKESRILMLPVAGILGFGLLSLAKVLLKAPWNWINGKTWITVPPAIFVGGVGRAWLIHRSRSYASRTEDLVRNNAGWFVLPLAIAIFWLMTRYFRGLFTQNPRAISETQSPPPRPTHWSTWAILGMTVIVVGMLALHEHAKPSPAVIESVLVIYAVALNIWIFVHLVAWGVKLAGAKERTPQTAYAAANDAPSLTAAVRPPRSPWSVLGWMLVGLMGFGVLGCGLAVIIYQAKQAPEKEFSAGFADRFQAALALENDTARHNTLVRLAEDAANDGDGDLVLKVIEHVDAGTARSNTCAICSEALLKRGMISAATAVAQQIEGETARSNMLARIAATTAPILAEPPPTSTSPTSPDPEAEALAQLQGKWHLTIRSPGPVLSNPDTYEAEAEVEGNLMKVFYTKELDASIPEERFLAHTVMLRVQRSEGKPQIDLLFGPNEEKVNRFLALGIAEFSEDLIRLCFDRSTDSESIRPEVFAVGAKAAIWELRRTPPVDSKAGMLARLQGLWVAEFETDPNGVDPAEAKHPGIALDASDVVFDVSGNVVTTSYITPHPDKPELPEWPEFSLQLGSIGKPQPVDLLWKTSTDPEGDGHVGIMEFSGEEVRLCFGDVKDRPQTFAAVKDSIYLVRLKRPSRESALHLGVQLAASPVGPDLLKDTPFRGGLRIEKVYAGTPAAEGGLLAGDVLVGLGAWEVAKLEDLQYALGLSLEGEVSFHILRDGQVRKGYVLLDGSERPASDAKLSPDQLTKLPVEVQRGHSTPASQSEPQAALLAQLQGTWDVDLSGVDSDGLPPGTRSEFTIEGNLLKFWVIVPAQPELNLEAQRIEEGAMLLTLGAAGPPQQVDLVIGPNDGDQRRETQGIIEITGDTVKLCYDPQKEKGAIQRPAAFAKGKQATMWTLTRRKASAPATELEGDWKLESYRSKDGTVLNPNHADAPLLEIRGNEVFYDSGRNPSKIEIDADWKTLSYQKDSEDEPSSYRYILKGEELTLRNAGESVLVYRRQVTPPSTSQATELEGDWHRVAVTAVDGTPIETPHFNVTIRGTTWTNQIGQTPEVIKFQTNLEKKTIEFSNTPPVLYAYELDGNRLILRDKTLTMVLERGHHSWAVTELEGDWHCISITDPTGKPLDHPKKNVSVRGDKWYSLPEHAPRNIQIHIEPGQKTIDFEKSITYAYWFHRNNLKLSGNRMVMEFARGHDAALEGAPMLEGNWTELEGDWHVVAYYDHEGKPKETLPSNRSFRGDQSSFVGPGHRHDCRIKVDPIKKTLWSYSKEEDGSFGQDYYELKGNQLILRNKPDAVGYQVFERGLVRIPSVVPPANEEQKLLWRSAIVEIVTYGDSHVNNGGENVVGRGVVVSPGGLILAHLAGRWDPPLKDRKVMARFDDGSRIPLTVVEEGDGFIAFQPEKPINANHYFKVSQTVVQPHDEVRIWGPDHSQVGSQSLAPYADRVTVLDRKYPALGIAVWQLRFSHHAVLGTPILDADGDLLGITITGTRDLLLVVPVAKLKELFPKTFGQPPAAAALIEPTDADQTRWRSAMVELYATKPGEDESQATRIGDGVVVSGKAEIVAYLPGKSDLASMTISAEFADGGRLDLELGEPSTRMTGNGMYCFRPKDERFRTVSNLLPFLPLAVEVPNQNVDRLYVGELLSPVTISRGADSPPGDLGIVNEHFANMWKMAPQPRTVRLGGKRRSDVTIAAGDPILSRDGQLVGMALSADPEFLALPVAELKELFPKTLGPMPAVVPPPPPAAVPSAAATKESEEPQAGEPPSE